MTQGLCWKVETGLQLEPLSGGLSDEQVLSLNQQNLRLLRFVNLHGDADLSENPAMQTISAQLGVMIELLCGLYPQDIAVVRQKIELYRRAVCFESRQVFAAETLLLLKIRLIDTLPVLLQLPVAVMEQQEQGRVQGNIFALEEEVLDQLDKWIFVQHRKKIAAQNKKNN